MPLIHPPWDVSLSDLTLDHLSEFFRDAGDEGLTWEAKGTKLISKAEIRKHACGFANQLGGFLIIGASRPNKAAWILDGVSFPSDEPGTWLADIARTGLSPVPAMDARSWPVAEDGRSLAVLQVEPVAAPPCLWDGRVYQRVTGQTVPVTDQHVLAELVQRGRAARARAQQSARDLAASLATVPVGAAAECQRLVIAISPISPSPSWWSALFTHAMRNEALNAISEWSDRHETHVFRRLQPDHGPDHVAYTAAFDGMRGHEAWGIHCTGAGTVAAYLERNDGEILLTDAGGISLRSAWSAALRVARGGGSFGPAYLAFASGAANRPAYGQLPLVPHPLTVELRDLTDPTDTSVARLERMILRAGGRVIYED